MFRAASFLRLAVLELTTHRVSLQVSININFIILIDTDKLYLLD